MNATNKPMVSVIIPTYNRANKLKSSINSVLNQTFRDLELIIVDDGSTDNTRAIVQEYQVQDKRVIYIFQNNSGGPAKPRNTGIKNSKGDYIAFLDHDDEWLPLKVEYQVSAFEREIMNNLAIVGCNTQIINSENDKNEYYSTPEPPSFLKQLLLRNFIHSCSSIMLTREALTRIGLFDEVLNRSDDWDMWIRLMERGFRYKNVNKVLNKYYIHDFNLTKQLGRLKNVTETEYIFRKHFHLYQQMNICDKMQWRLGAEFCIVGNLEKGKKYLLQSLRSNPEQIRGYILLFAIKNEKIGYIITRITYNLYRFVRSLLILDDH